MSYTEDYEQQRGKGSFPAMITPAYQIAKRANELASDVSVHGNVVLLEEEAGSYLGLASPTSCLLLPALWIQEEAFHQFYQDNDLALLCLRHTPWTFKQKKNIPQDIHSHSSGLCV